jgi:hypothetical protein
MDHRLLIQELSGGHVSVALQREGQAFGEPVAFHSLLGERECEDLRVLMVIARPAGLNDVGYQMIARLLMERLDAVRGRIQPDVLRPPTSTRWRRGCGRPRTRASPTRCCTSTAMAPWERCRRRVVPPCLMPTQPADTSCSSRRAAASIWLRPMMISCQSRSRSIGGRARFWTIAKPNPGMSV